MPDLVCDVGEGYQGLLDRAWQEHLAPKGQTAPTHISLFAGPGGSALGASMAGFRGLLAVEQDDAAVVVFRANFPEVPVWHGNIQRLAAEEILEITGLAVGQLDFMDASPPCKGFSRAGRRRFADPRNGLWKEVLRIGEALRPKAMVIENVKGMLDSDLRPIFDEMIHSLAGAGYRLRYWLFDASEYQVPQARRRVVVIGVREDLLCEPSIPAQRLPQFTVAKALLGLPRLQFAPAAQGDLALIVPAMVAGSKASKHHALGHKFNTYRLHPDKPANTVLAYCGPSTCLMVHPEEPRPLSVDEAKRLQSFPDQFTMCGDHFTRWRLIGDAVPPLLMRSLSRHVRQVLESAQASVGERPWCHQ